jgi:phenylacetate-CoA ligase
LNEFHTRFEIVDRDPEGYGELVYTTLNRRVMPLVRYRTGDITRFAPSRAPSLLPGLRIEKIKGRTNEWTATGMGNLAPWMFEPVFGAVGGIGLDWQLILDKDNNLDRVILAVERLDAAKSDAEIKADILKEVENRLGEMWRYVKMGFGKMEVQIHPRASLRVGRKLLRLVDKRKF